MRYAVLLVCIILNRVCTATKAADLPVGQDAPEPEGKCMHNISISLPVGPAIRWRGPPRIPANPGKGKICSCTGAGNVTFRILCPLPSREQDVLKQLQMVPVTPANYQQGTMNRLADKIPSLLLQPSSDDTKFHSRQHPATTGFSESNPTMGVHAVHLLEVAALTGTPPTAIAQGLAKAVQGAPFPEAALAGAPGKGIGEQYMEVDWEQSTTGSNPPMTSSPSQPAL